MYSSAVEEVLGSFSRALVQTSARRHRTQGNFVRGISSWQVRSLAANDEIVD